MKYLIALITILCPIVYFVGTDMRLVQEVFMQLSSLVLVYTFVFSKHKQLAKSHIDTWIGIFGLWSICLFVLFQCAIGYSALMNILSGILIYFVVSRSLEKKDIPLIFKAVIFVCILNSILLTMQMMGYDPIFVVKGAEGITDHMGFFALKAAMGVYYALAISLIAYFSPLIAFFALLPIGVSVSSGAVVGGAVSYLFYLWNKARKGFLVALCLIVVGGALFIIKIDSPMGMFTTRPPMWKKVFKDVFRSPVYGHGLNSFREGKIKYMKDASNDDTYRAVKDDKGDGYLITEVFKKESVKFDWWDNPHNEYLQLVYEFGFMGLFICSMVVYYMYKKIKKAVKTKELIAICGFFVALFLCSMTQFPMHLARNAYLLPIMLALFRIETDEQTIVET